MCADFHAFITMCTIILLSRPIRNKKNRRKWTTQLNAKLSVNVSPPSQQENIRAVLEQSFTKYTYQDQLLYL